MNESNPSDQELAELLTLTVSVNERGTTTYCNHLGHKHRIHGPAVITSTGNRYWYQNGQLHRTDGPAIEGTDGSQFWYLNGQLHREDGPASISGNGRQRWYLKGKRIGKADYEKLTASVEEMTMAQVEAALGKRVKIIK